MSELKSYKDFEVEECVTQYYQHEIWQDHPGKWFWHCLTCDTGSGRKPQKRKGHSLEGSAMIGAKYHANQMRKNRQYAAWQAWWNKEFYTTKDLAFFRRLWSAKFGYWENRRRDMTEEQIMRYMQTGKVEELGMYGIGVRS